METGTWSAAAVLGGGVDSHGIRIPVICRFHFFVVPTICKVIYLKWAHCYLDVPVKTINHIYSRKILSPYSQLRFMYWNETALGRGRDAEGREISCRSISWVDFSKLNSTAKSTNNGTFKCSDFNNLHFTFIYTNNNVIC